jgi:phosphoglucosamine mutase
MIFRQYATTGDGMLTALKILEVCAHQQVSLDDLAADLVVYPQLLVNIRVKARKPLEELPRVVEEIRASEAVLDGTGRVLVRFSGTEPLARVMVEGPDPNLVKDLAEKIAASIRAELG